MADFNKENIFMVTGASSGIGEGTALALNELGATVIAIARNEDRLNKMKAKCKYPENMHLEIKDLTENIEELPNFVTKLKEKYGKFADFIEETVKEFYNGKPQEAESALNKIFYDNAEDIFINKKDAHRRLFSFGGRYRT